MTDIPHARRSPMEHERDEPDALGALEKRVADLARNTNRAKRRGDPNFERIRSEYRAAKGALMALAAPMSTKPPIR